VGRASTSNQVSKTAGNKIHDQSQIIGYSCDDNASSITEAKHGMQGDKKALLDRLSCEGKNTEGALPSKHDVTNAEYNAQVD
jgi:hypothetical protein